MEMSLQIKKKVISQNSSSGSNTSTGSKGDQHGRYEPRSKPKFRRLKLLSINCRGLKSKQKQRDLHSVIQQEDPDIICGCETHLDGSYNMSGVFPGNYDIYRKERNSHGGGVFIGLRQDLLGMEEESLQTDCESISGLK